MARRPRSTCLRSACAPSSAGTPRRLARDEMAQDRHGVPEPVRRLAAGRARTDADLEDRTAVDVSAHGDAPRDLRVPEAGERLEVTVVRREPRLVSVELPDQ